MHNILDGFEILARSDALGRKKVSSTYKGENSVFAFSKLFFFPILLILAGNEKMRKS